VIGTARGKPHAFDPNAQGRAARDGAGVGGPGAAVPRFRGPAQHLGRGAHARHLSRQPAPLPLRQPRILQLHRLVAGGGDRAHRDPGAGPRDRGADQTPCQPGPAGAHGAFRGLARLPDRRASLHRQRLRPGGPRRRPDGRLLRARPRPHRAAPAGGGAGAAQPPARGDAGRGPGARLPDRPRPPLPLRQPRVLRVRRQAAGGDHRPDQRGTRRTGGERDARALRAGRAGRPHGDPRGLGELPPGRNTSPGFSHRSGPTTGRWRACCCSCATPPS
jgi:hypothetical protein